ncbi:hypothetical protein CVT25_006082 [Psilocybe cyanescens]|uniref:Uncharacterized protein n=1 Tax=Psilocybe cyanescens TaxID=93625 RepID=A0A409XA45_PSICY|nr:hypothetical protein CVT25_006082 [Psilocybe cyanescens]
MEHERCMHRYEADDMDTVSCDGACRQHQRARVNLSSSSTPLLGKDGGESITRNATHIKEYGVGSGNAIEYASCRGTGNGT